MCRLLKKRKLDLRNATLYVQNCFEKCHAEINWISEIFFSLIFSIYQFHYFFGNFSVSNSDTFFNDEPLFLKNIILARFASQIYNTSIWPALHVYTRRLFGSNQAPRRRILTLNSPVHRLTVSLVVLASTHEQRFLAIIDDQIACQCRR